MCVCVCLDGSMKVVFDRLNCMVSVCMVVLFMLCVLLNM